MVVVISNVGLVVVVVVVLAVMSSSRSDVVTKSVRVSVRSSVPFFSFSVIGVYSAFRMS